MPDQMMCKDCVRRKPPHAPHEWVSAMTNERIRCPGWRVGELPPETRLCHRAEAAHPPHAHIRDREVYQCPGIGYPGGTEPEAAKDRQIGGDHYKSMKIQPIDFIVGNELDWFSGNIVKYACRHRAKGGKQDLEKVIHYAQLAIQHYYGDED